MNPRRQRHGGDGGRAQGGWEQILTQVLGKDLGRTAVLVALMPKEAAEQAAAAARAGGIRMIHGAVGSMQGEKVIAAVETAARRENLIDGESYREVHALYHAVVEAMAGIGRGQVLLGEMLRTAGLTFAVARGPRKASLQGDADWLAVALYGTMGAPVKGFEHEVLGLGINHI